MNDTAHLKALTLDLDDTLWPVWPAIARAEVRLMDWLREFAPATAAAHTSESLRALRNKVSDDHPEWAHDLSVVRLTSIRLALLANGEDPALAEPAFDAFFTARHEVDLFPDVLHALDRLAARWPLLALSNGNADVARVGLGRYFVGSVSAREFGVGKPAPEIFHAACARLMVQPQEVLHIGDDPALDVDGAMSAGLRAAWVTRPGMPHNGVPKGTPHHQVNDLGMLVLQLGV